MFTSLRRGFPQARLVYSHQTRRPDIEDLVEFHAGAPAETVEAIVAFASENDVDVAVPCRSPELFVRALPLLREKGIAAAMPSGTIETIELLCDKAATYASIDEIVVGSTPRWLTVSTPSELLAAVQTWTSRGQRVCFKPVQGEGAAGFRIVDPGAGETDNFLTWPTSVLSLRRFEEIVSGLPKVPRLLVSDYLPGPEYSVDVASRDGEVVVSVIRRKVNSWHQRIEADACINRAVSALSESLRLHGCWNVQFRNDIDGKPKLLEVNPRLSAGSMYLSAVEVNFAEMAVRIARGLPIARPRVPDSADLWRHEISVASTARAPSDVNAPSAT